MGHPSAFRRGKKPLGSLPEGREETNPPMITPWERVPKDFYRSSRSISSLIGKKGYVTQRSAEFLITCSQYNS